MQTMIWLTTTKIIKLEELNIFFKKVFNCIFLVLKPINTFLIWAFVLLKIEMVFILDLIILNLPKITFNMVLTML